MLIKIYFFLLLCFFGSIFAREYSVANIVSIPSRIISLEKTIESIIFQVDHINVFLNNYSQIPDYLNNPKISIFLSQEFGDLGSNGKFFLSEHMHGYYFTMDDDLIYPPDYVDYLIEKIEQYQRKAVVGIHGSIFKSKVSHFFKDRYVFHFKRELKKDTFVNMLGTGTTAYHTDTINIRISCFLTKNKDDLYFAIEAKKQKIPMVCLARPEKFIQEQPTAYQTTSIFETSWNNCGEHVRLFNQYAPWPILKIKKD